MNGDSVQDLKVMSLSVALFPERKLEVWCKSQNYLSPLHLIVS